MLKNIEVQLVLESKVWNNIEVQLVLEFKVWFVIAAPIVIKLGLDTSIWWKKRFVAINPDNM